MGPEKRWLGIVKQNQNKDGNKDKNGHLQSQI